METVKLIGRISKKGNEYLQTAIKVEGQEENKFIPVFLKKGIESLHYNSMEKKVDKKNVFFPVEEDGSVSKAIITK